MFLIYKEHEKEMNGQYSFEKLFNLINKFKNF